MVHLTFNNKPICEHAPIRCQYPTRREAFDNMRRMGLNKEVQIRVGRCPNFEKEKP